MKNVSFLILSLWLCPMMIVAQTRIETNGSPDLILHNTNALSADVTSRMFFKSGNYFGGGIATVGTSNVTSRLSFYTNTSTDRNNLIERVSILHNGYVGFANTNPQYPVHMKNNGIGFTQESISGQAKIGFYTNAASAYLQTHNNIPLYFATNNASVQMTLTTAGRFGIGTTTPVSKLEVKGKITATQQSGEDAALEISGSLKLTGSNPVAFVIAALETGQTELVIDHPAANGNPDALLFVTNVRPVNDYFNGSFSVKYNTTTQKWMLIATGARTNTIHENIDFKTCDGGCVDYIQVASVSSNFFPQGTKFNVLIILS